MDTLERKLLIAQARRELLYEITQYLVGIAKDGEIVARKEASFSEWDGYILVIPEDKYTSYLAEK